MSQSDANRMIADAEAAVAALAAEYVIYARDDLANLRRLYEAAAPVLANADAPVFCAQAAEMFSIVHNVKGQGGAFGYDLLTELGSSLCMRLRGREDEGRVGRARCLLSPVGPVEAGERA